jgi:hypothetical protein
LADISSNPVVEPPAPGETERPRSLALYKTLLQRVAAMDIVREWFPNCSPLDTFLSVSEVIGCLDLLELGESRLYCALCRRHAYGERVSAAPATGTPAAKRLLRAPRPLSDSLLEGKIVGENTDGVILWR